MEKVYSVIKTTCDVLKRNE